MKTGNKHYGLDVYDVDGDDEYAVGDDTDATRDSRGRTEVDHAARLAVEAKLNSVDPDKVARAISTASPAFDGVPVAEIADGIRGMRDFEGACAAFIRHALGYTRESFITDVLDASDRGTWLAEKDGAEVRPGDPGAEWLPQGKVAFQIK